VDPWAEEEDLLPSRPPAGNRPSSERRPPRPFRRGGAKEPEAGEEEKRVRIAFLGRGISCRVDGRGSLRNPIRKRTDHPQCFSQSVGNRQKARRRSRAVHANPAHYGYTNRSSRPLQQNTKLISPCPTAYYTG
jgi:hypothetical protein